MRYRFKGMIRETGRVVEGHVEAPTEQVAYNVLGDNGIVCESMRPDPRQGDYTTGGVGQVNDEVSSAVDSALDTAAHEVDFDTLTNRYKGKKVWVLDRSKIRDRVKKVVLQSISTSQIGEADQADTLAKVNEALDKMFADKRNVSSPAGEGGLAIEEQIARLSAVARNLESAVAQMSAIIRRGGFGGGGGGGRLSYNGLPARDKRHDKVLLEIFESNLELQRTIDQPEGTPATPGDSSGVSSGSGSVAAGPSDTQRTAPAMQTAAVEAANPQAPGNPETRSS